MIIEKICHYLFGWQYVLLHDHDGEVSVRRAKKLGRYWVVWRFSMNVHMLILAPHGKIANRDRTFVERWDPLTDGIVFGVSDYGAE